MDYLETEDTLSHFGIKGMKWGRRKAKSIPDGAHPDYIRAHSHKPIHAMSTKELNELNNRITAEQNYARLIAKRQNAGAKFVSGIITDIARERAKDLISKKAIPAVTAFIAKKVAESAN